MRAIPLFSLPFIGGLESKMGKKKISKLIFEIWKSSSPDSCGLKEKGV
jgi:hypothetical protein